MSKTLTAIATLGTAYKLGNIEKVLIIAPTSVCSVWAKEFEDYADFKAVVKVLLGAKGKRLKALSDLERFPFKAIKLQLSTLKVPGEKIFLMHCISGMQT